MTLQLSSLRHLFNIQIGIQEQVHRRPAKYSVCISSKCTLSHCIEVSTHLPMSCSTQSRYLLSVTRQVGRYFGLKLIQRKRPLKNYPWPIYRFASIDKNCKLARIVGCIRQVGRKVGTHSLSHSPNDSQCADDSRFLAMKAVSTFKLEETGLIPKLIAGPKRM